MTKTHYAILMIFAACTAIATPVQLRWICELSDPQPYTRAVWRGETVQLAAELRLYGQPVTLPVAASATMYWQTNGMADAWWTAPATVSTNGALAATWTPAMDSGAGAYTFFIAADADGATLYRAYGRLRMIHAPGAVPNEIELPARAIDFAAVTVLNPPWPAAIAAATNGLISAESDPVAAAWQSAHLAANNPHGITPEGIGAVPLSGGTLHNGATINGTYDAGFWEFGGSGVVISDTVEGVISELRPSGLKVATGPNAYANYGVGGLEFGSVGNPFYVAYSQGGFFLEGSSWNSFREPGTYTLAATSDIDALQSQITALSAAPQWLVRDGLSGTVSFANTSGSPQAWSGSGALTISGFSGLDVRQCYLTMQGFTTVTFPASVYWVGGGNWQSGMVNHFTVWQVGAQVFASFLTATPIP